MKYVLNSAVITSPGVWSYKLVSLNEAKQWLQEGGWESTIGHLEIAKALATLTGIEIPVNRKQMIMKEGDEALVFRLTKRLPINEKKKVFTVEILRNCEIGILRKEARW